MVSTQETRRFDAEVGKVLHLMIHSLYTNKDIFLRELISNASDACDKLRYEVLTTPDLLKDDTQLKVVITTNPKQRTLTITDNGIGMSRQELIDHLGTIARSGTQNFMNQLTGDQKHDMQLIGQFGVGFYSSFMIAENVTVISRKAGEEKAHIWDSKGDGEFTVMEAEGTHPRGTSITLRIREGEEDYLDKHRIKHIAATYSDHIALPILLIDEEGKEETINTGSALWARSKSDITEEQYQQFYKHVAHAGDAPWMTLHNKAEGTLEYTNLLYIPSTKPFDLFHPDRTCRVKLYVKRVFITEQGVELVPPYMRFLRGVVDSQDLPLNISRETLQHNATVNRIRKSITKKVLSELKKKAENEQEEFRAFWDNFGAVLKEGLCDAMEDRDQLLEVCRFQSTKSEGKLISMDEYISRMKEGQDTIYYLTGDSIEIAQKSPQLEGFLKRDVEVILLADSVDDFWVNVVHDYKEKKLKSVTRADINLDEFAPLKDKEPEAEKSEEAKKEEKEGLNALVDFIRETLKDRIADVRVSHKLTDSPVCLAVSEWGMDIRMERFLVDQKQLPSASAKILEINPQHPIIQRIAKDVQDDSNSDRVKEVAFLLFDQACIVEGEHIKDPGAFSQRLSKFVKEALAA